MQTHTFLGYPEADTSCPFAFVIRLEQGWLVVTGVLNRQGSTEAQELYSNIVSAAEYQQVLVNIASSNLQPVHQPYFCWWMETAFRRGMATIFEEYTILQMLVSAQKPSIFRDIPYNPSIAQNTHYMVNQDTGVVFAVPDAILSEAIKGMQIALKNDSSVQQQLIEAVVESSADLAFDPEECGDIRERWLIALEALALIYHHKDKEAPQVSVVVHNRLAIVANATGSQVPFVRVWCNQQLLNAVAIAQLWARDESNAQ
jgi:hypothetical protein